MYITIMQFFYLNRAISRNKPITKRAHFCHERVFLIQIFHFRPHSAQNVTVTSPSPSRSCSSALEMPSIFATGVRLHEFVS